MWEVKGQDGGVEDGLSPVAVFEVVEVSAAALFAEDFVVVTVDFLGGPVWGVLARVGVNGGLSDEGDVSAVLDEASESSLVSAVRIILGAKVLAFTCGRSGKAAEGGYSGWPLSQLHQGREAFE